MTTRSSKIFQVPGNGTLVFTFADFETNFINGKKEVKKACSLEELKLLLQNEEFQEKVETHDPFHHYALILFFQSIEKMNTCKETLHAVLRELRQKQQNINTKVTYEIVLSVYKCFLFRQKKN